MIGGASSPQEAKRRAENMKNCPHLLFSGTTADTIYAVYIVSSEKEWWLTYPEKHPKETGLETAKVYIIKNIEHLEKTVHILPKKKTETAPCGANCKTCPLRVQYSCSGCPATVHYQEKIQEMKQ